MKNLKISLIFMSLILVSIFCLTSCFNSPTDIAKSKVKDYLKLNLKNNKSYESISFTELDTLNVSDTMYNNFNCLYSIIHNYSIINSNHELVKMSIIFYLDKDLNICNCNTKNINGDYGILTGNIYWEYNKYVGNKSDDNSEITLYSLDSIRGGMKFQTKSDMFGNYRIENIPTGKYFLMIRSNNTTDCPENHIANLKRYAKELNQLFGFDIIMYKQQLDKIALDDSLAMTSYKNLSKMTTAELFKATENYYKHIEDSRIKSNELIEQIPQDFKHKINLYTGYSNANYFAIILINEGKIENIITDFGNTCI